jgi:hypothetical protein
MNSNLCADSASRRLRSMFMCIRQWNTQSQASLARMSLTTPDLRSLAYQQLTAICSGAPRDR